MDQQLQSCVDFFVSGGNDMMTIVIGGVLVVTYVIFAFTKNNIVDAIRKMAGKLLADKTASK